MYIIAVPGSGHPIGELDIAIELFQIVFIILCSVIIATKTKTQMNKQRMSFIIDNCQLYQIRLIVPNEFVRDLSIPTYQI